MKTVLVAIALCISSVSYADQAAFVNTAALGRPHTVLAASFTNFNIDAREAFARANTGSVTVDTQAREITVSFEFRPVCNGICSQLIQELGSITVPLVSAQPDQCGGITYTGSRDLMRVDGGMQAIVVTDNSHFRCQTLRAVDPTAVTVREIPARATFNEERVSSFIATPLRNTISQSRFAR